MTFDLPLYNAMVEGAIGAYHASDGSRSDRAADPAAASGALAEIGALRLAGARLAALAAVDGAACIPAAVNEAGLSTARVAQTLGLTEAEVVRALSVQPYGIATDLPQPE